MATCTAATVDEFNTFFQFLIVMETMKHGHANSSIVDF